MKKFYIPFLITCLSSQLTFASEFILTVNRIEQVIVTTSSQTQTNNNNKFKFYNLQGGFIPVKVVDQWSGQVLFQNNVSIPVDYKVQAVLDQYGNMTITSSQPIYNNGNNVGTVTYNGNSNWNNNQGNTGYGNWNNHPQHIQCGTVHNNTNTYFSQFLETVRNESFDSNRLKIAKTYANQTALTAEQIKQIATTFSFDSNRLEWAKTAYNSCVDKGNYFLLKNTFSFSSNYTDLMDYINQ